MIRKSCVFVDKSVYLLAELKLVRMVIIKSENMKTSMLGAALVVMAPIVVMSLVLFVCGVLCNLRHTIMLRRRGLSKVRWWAIFSADVKWMEVSPLGAVCFTWAYIMLAAYLIIADFCLIVIQLI